MNVRIFFPLPDPYRRSMFVVGNNLIHSLRSVASDRDRIAAVHPIGNGQARRRGLSRYYYQYLKYQATAGRHAGGICHIIDSAYAHLLFSVRPERCVVTVHDLMRYRQPEPARGMSVRSGVHALLRQYNAAAIRRAAHVIAVSEGTARDCAEFLAVSPERMTVVHNGVDEAFFHPREEAVRRLRAAWRADGRFTLIHVGHVGSYKNIENLIKALAVAVRDNGLDCVLVKAGHRLDDSQRDLAADCGVADRIVEVGEVPVADLPAVYAAADALVVPSVHEGFGLPVLEAMACGTPVVASDIGVFREVAGEGAVFVDPRSPWDIAAGICRLAGDGGLRRSLAVAGKERARHFTWHKAAEKVYQIYLSMQ